MNDASLEQHSSYLHSTYLCAHAWIDGPQSKKAHSICRSISYTSVRLQHTRLEIEWWIARKRNKKMAKENRARGWIELGRVKWVSEWLNVRITRRDRHRVDECIDSPPIDQLSFRRFCTVLGTSRYQLVWAICIVFARMLCNCLRTYKQHQDVHVFLFCIAKWRIFVTQAKRALTVLYRGLL